MQNNKKRLRIINRQWVNNFINKLENNKQKICLLGPLGLGKSTFCNLMDLFINGNKQNKISIQKNKFVLQDVINKSSITPQTLFPQIYDFQNIQLVDLPSSILSSTKTTNQIQMIERKITCQYFLKGIHQCSFVIFVNCSITLNKTDGWRKTILSFLQLFNIDQLPDTFYNSVSFCFYKCEKVQEQQMCERIKNLIRQFKDHQNKKIVDKLLNSIVEHKRIYLFEKLKSDDIISNYKEFIQKTYERIKKQKPLSFEIELKHIQPFPRLSEIEIDYIREYVEMLKTIIAQSFKIIKWLINNFKGSKKDIENYKQLMQDSQSSINLYQQDLSATFLKKSARKDEVLGKSSKQTNMKILIPNKMEILWRYYQLYLLVQQKNATQYPSGQMQKKKQEDRFKMIQQIFDTLLKYNNNKESIINSYLLREEIEVMLFFIRWFIKDQQFPITLKSASDVAVGQIGKKQLEQIASKLKLQFNQESQDINYYQKAKQLADILSVSQKISSQVQQLNEISKRCSFKFIDMKGKEQQKLDILIRVIKDYKKKNIQQSLVELIFKTGKILEKEGYYLQALRCYKRGSPYEVFRLFIKCVEQNNRSALNLEMAFQLIDYLALLGFKNMAQQMCCSLSSIYFDKQKRTQIFNKKIEIQSKQTLKSCIQIFKQSKILDHNEELTEQEMQKVQQVQQQMKQKRIQKQLEQKKIEQMKTCEESLIRTESASVWNE